MIKEKNIWVLGDIHGAYKALQQVIQRSNIDKENDTLIFLGDITDGYSEVYECVEELLSFKNLISIRGNHDQWFLDFLKTGVNPVMWQQGGEGTKNSYMINTGSSTVGELIHKIPKTHREYFERTISHLELQSEEEEKYIFTHGGFDRTSLISDQDIYTLMWDRNLWEAAIYAGHKKLHFADVVKKVYIGHTQCNDRNNPDALPLFRGGIWNLDTGAGWTGKLTMMNLKTEKYVQSDWVTDLYPGVRSR